MRKFSFIFRFHKELSQDLPEEYDKNLYENDKYSVSYVVRSKPLILKRLQDSTFKGFAIDNELIFSIYNYKKKPEDRLFFHQLDQKMISYNIHVAFSPEHDFLYSTFDWKIKRLVESGFFVHWIDQYLSHPSLWKPEPEDDKVVLTMDHLMVGFTIWLGILLIASFAMILELVRVYLAKNVQRILFQMILRKHQRLQRND